MYSRMLVPTDGSDCSDRAVAHAVRLGHATRAAIIFLYVVDTIRNYHEGVMNEVKRTLAEQGMAVLVRAEKFALEAGVTAGIELLEGDPPEVILERAPEFDLVIMGSHGKGFWERVTVGSVTHAVIRRIACPILIIPPAG